MLSLTGSVVVRKVSALLMKGCAAVAPSVAVLVTTLVVREMLSTSTPTELMADCSESCKQKW